MNTRIWNDTKLFPNKVNFIDNNNVILGYDLFQNCCEHAFWTISENKDGSDPIYESGKCEREEIELDGYAFDTDFYERDDDESREQYVAIFGLVGSVYRDDLPDLYIRLENHHNGYYSHGFTFSGKNAVDDSL